MAYYYKHSKVVSIAPGEITDGSSRPIDKQKVIPALLLLDPTLKPETERDWEGSRARYCSIHHHDGLIRAFIESLDMDMPIVYDACDFFDDSKLYAISGRHRIAYSRALGLKSIQVLVIPLFDLAPDIEL